MLSGHCVPAGAPGRDVPKPARPGAGEGDEEERADRGARQDEAGVRGDQVHQREAHTEVREGWALGGSVGGSVQRLTYRQPVCRSI